MSEYWKSVPRKFCDYCKCWLTDNKPSIEFHERGKRHQENVELRLREIRKKSSQESMEQKKIDEEMAKMEKAALEAFKKDLKENPALAAQYGVSLEPKPETKSEKSSEYEESSSKEKTRKRKSTAAKKEWYEAVSPEGYSYYWSTVTGESKWTAPEEYVSIVEQAEEEQEKKKEEEEDDSDNKTAEPVVGADTEPEGQSSKPVQTADTRTGFGSWEVVREEKQPVNFDESSVAPELEDIPLPSSMLGGTSEEPRPQKPKFKEKTVGSLGPTQSGPVAFKKRKVASGARNVRQRDNDD